MRIQILGTKSKEYIFIEENTDGTMTIVHSDDGRITQKHFTKLEFIQKFFPSR